MSSRLAALTCVLILLPLLAGEAVGAEAAPSAKAPTGVNTAEPGSRVSAVSRRGGRPPTPVATTTPTPTDATAQLFASRVVAGSADVTDSAGRRWSGRTAGWGSWSSTSVSSLRGTNDAALYRDTAPGMRWYRLDTPAPAQYTVRLLFTEPYFSSGGQRVFDVKAEGKIVATGVDIARKVGKNAAYDLMFTVPVSDGRLDLDFVGTVDQPILSGVEVVSTTRVAALAPVAPKVALSPDSFFFKDVRSAPLAANSAQAAAHLQAQVMNNWGGVAAFNAYRYNNSFYEVGATTPKVNVAFYDCQNKGYTPYGLFDGPAHFVDVPIPANAVAATGTDKQLTIYDRAADKLWDFWVTERMPDGALRACWGGRIDGVSSSQGIFTAPFGATASGLAMTPGAIGIEEFRRGRIDHAMHLAVIDPVRWDTFSWPANRSDGGSTDPNAVMEGQRLRLDPTLDLSTLVMTPVARMVAVAAQKYGFVVADRSGAVTVITESGNKEKATTGVDPWDTLLPGPDYDAMRGFPWDRIQVLPKDFGRPAN